MLKKFENSSAYTVDIVEISYGDCQEILTGNLNMRRLARKFVQLLMVKVKLFL
jgi:hypothetical protein